MQQSIIGKIIDNYQITGILGKGGMGVVYRAKDMTLDRDVALKMMDANVARDEEFLKRFKSEAKALARLQNPNIVSVFALRETELGFCLVMELVEGGTLSDRIKNAGAIELHRLIPIFKQITTALDHAHQVGVIHRDIKPSNVMLTADDFVKVTDFGLAKIQQVTSATVTMGTGGTLYYMSPEQVKGLANVDARGDIYSIGMTLYEAATGRVPFGNDVTDFDIRQMIVEGKVPPPERFMASLPKELGAIIQRSIHKDPAKRFQTCAEMCDALSAVPLVVEGNGKPQQAQRKQVVYKSQRPNRMPFYATLLIGALLIASFFIYRQFFASASSFLSVNSSPEGAQVFLDSKAMGRAPLKSLEIQPGVVHIRVESKDYFPKDTTVTVKRDEHAKLSLSLVRVPPPPSKTDSVAVSVTENPKEQFTTQPSLASEITNKPAAVSKSVDADVGVNRPATISVATAKLLMRSVPSGSVSVDGGKPSPSASTVSLDVAPGQRRLLFEHPAYGRKQFTVSVKPNETKQVTCYFEARASIVVSGDAQWAFIVRDGVRTEDQAPAVITLPVGRHRISVTKVGFDVVEGERIVLVEPALEQREFKLPFTLVKK